MEKMPILSDATQEGIIDAAELICNSKRVVVLSGAGISTPSGIPDFRSPNTGLWEKNDPYEVASLSAFRYHPERFFEWMRSLAACIFAAKPNAAHYSLAQLEQKGHLHAVITQNIDILHQRAGSKNVYEVHGSFATLTCVRCYRQYDSAGYMSAYLERGEIPHCPDCTGILKPDLVLFGEQLPAKTWLKAVELSKRSDLMIIAGSSLEVLPVAGLPMRALENGAHLILINHSETYLDVRADVVFHDDVDVIIPRIVDQVCGG
jgi:NAD-dependent deacetylase